MRTYSYQDSATLTSLTPELIQSSIEDDPIFTYVFPVRNRNSAKLRWTIKDLYRGLMQLRGLGGEPSRVNKVGENVFEAEPAAFGEYETIDELEMTNRAAGMPANVTVPIDVKDLVAEGQEQLTMRQTQRMKQMAWALAIAGAITIGLPTGGTGYRESYTNQTVTVSPLWSSLTTATPLANLRSLQPTFGFGTSNKFGMGAVAIMNSQTALYLLGNTNAADLGGKRVEGGSTINDVPGITKILNLQGAPTIVIHDDGYIDDSGVFQLYCPTGKVLIVGMRPAGEKPGEFQITRNANNPNVEAKPYAFVDDRTQGPARTVPPRIDVHQGFNGGAVVERASQLIVLTVA